MVSPRTLITLALGATLAVGVGSVPGVVAQATPASNAGQQVPVRGTASVPATVDDIVSRNLQARGGLERLRAVQAIKMKGLMQASNGTDLPTTLYMQRPSRIRQEVTVNGRLAIQAFDGERGWAQNPMMGNAPVEVPVGVAKRMAEQADFDGPLVDAASKGHKLEWLGTEQVGEVTVSKVKLAKKGGEEQVLFFDTATGQQIKTQGEIEQGGRKLTVESRYSDFRTVDGLSVPFNIEVLVNGQTQQRVSLSNVEFPATLDDQLFRMPGR